MGEGNTPNISLVLDLGVIQVDSYAVRRWGNTTVEGMG